MRAAVRIGIALPALLIFGWAALSAARLGSVDSALYVAAREMSTWSASGVQPGQETVGWIRAELDQALERDRANPSLHEMVGRLALFTRRDDAPGQAITAFTEGLQHRPTWPYSWASLADALYRKGDTGPAFEAALQRAAETGPWEPEVQRIVADYGLAVWNDVSSSTRSEIERMVANGMARNAAEILQISLRRGRLGVACAHLGPSSRTDPKLAQLCQSTEAT
jgi:predicted Zn-dependent protease